MGASIYTLHNRNTDTKCTFQVSFQGIAVDAVYDTGADICCINAELYAKLCKKTNCASPLPLVKPPCLSTASGKSLKAKGVTWLKFQIGLKYFRFHAVIVEDLRSQLLLGQTWIRRNKVDLVHDDEGTQALSQGGRIFAYCTNSEAHNKAPV